MKKVKIEVTLEQAKIISQALDWSARTSMGQLSSSYLPGSIQEHLYGDPKEDKDWLYRRDLWDTFADGMKKILWPNLSYSSFMSYSHSEFSRHCCSMNKMLNVKMQEDRYKDLPEEERYENVDSSFCDIYDVPVAKVEIVKTSEKSK